MRCKIVPSSGFHILATFVSGYDVSNNQKKSVSENSIDLLVFTFDDCTVQIGVNHDKISSSYI